MEPSAHHDVHRRAEIAALRAAVSGLEQGGAVRRALSLGMPALDDRLPGGGLPLACLHEIEGARAEWDEAAATGFCLLLLARLLAARPGPLLWVAARDDLYAHGLSALGVDPDRLILVRTRGEAELLWAVEEGLRCRDLAAVVGETAGLERRAGRRLQLAAEANGVTAFALTRRLGPARREPSAAATRWRVSAAPSRPPAFAVAGGDRGFIGRPRWRVELLRCRGAPPGAWLLEAPDEACGGENPEGEGHAAGDFALAAALCDGTPEPQPAGTARLAG
jgi:protein ImuA